MAKEIKKIINFMKQNNYEICFDLLMDMKNDINHELLSIFLNRLELVSCKNDALYCFFYSDEKAFLIKFKDNKSINLVTKTKHRLLTNKNYNFNYEEEDITINNHQFVIIYNMEKRIIIIDKNSKRILVVIRQDKAVINADILEFFNQSLYERYKGAYLSLTTEQKYFPAELIPTITKCQVILSLSS